MAERPIAAVLKTVEPARVPGVQIPLSPLFFSTQLIKKRQVAYFVYTYLKKARFRKYLIISVSINSFYNISVNIVNFVSANRRCRHYFGVFAGYLSYFDDFLF